MAATSTKVSQSTIESAINALLKHKASQSEKLQLLPQDDYVYLNITLKKIPSNTHTNPFRIPLPHPIMDPTSELCLIIDDRENTPTPPSDKIKKLVKAENIPISKVVKLSKLKANNKPFEAKRKLCDSYDLFLVDKRILHLLPKLIGKEFFKKKKLPLGVDLGKRNLKSQVDRALGSAFLYLRSGTCSVVKVGKVSMDEDEIVENVFDAINGAVEMVPRKWEGVRSLHLKFSNSVALPVYQAMPDVNLKVEGTEVAEEEKKSGKGKVSDSEVEGKESSGVRKVGKKKNNKGRIHEVRYMDVGDDVVDLNGSDLVKEEIVDVVLGDVGIDGSDEGLKAGKTGGKKRKVCEEKKLKKKKAKVDKSESEEQKKNDGIVLVEKVKMDKSVVEKRKENDGIESVEKKPKKVKVDKKEVEKMKNNDGIEPVEKKPKKVMVDRSEVKKPKKKDGITSVEKKPKKKSKEGVAKKSKKTEGMEAGEIKPKKKCEEGAAKKTDAMDSAEKKGKKRSGLEKKLNGDEKVKDGKQTKRVSFK